MFDPKARVIPRVKWRFQFDNSPRGVLQVVSGATHSQKPSAVPGVLQIMICKHLLCRKKSGDRPHDEARQISFIFVKFQYSNRVRLL